MVGSIAVSWGFDLQAHGVSTLGVVPSGLPSLGFPSGVGWSDVGPLLATCGSMFLVIIARSAATSRAYAVKYKEDFEENNDLVGLSLANITAGLSSTFVVNGSPTKTKMAEESRARSQVAMFGVGLFYANAEKAGAGGSAGTCSLARMSAGRRSAAQAGRSASSTGSGWELAVWACCCS